MSALLLEQKYKEFTVEELIMFKYIYNGKEHTDTSKSYMDKLKIDEETQQSILNQKEFEYTDKCKQVRDERNKRLAATDFYMLQDAPAAPNGLMEYRQALRDITEQDGFPELIEWPELVL